MKKPISRTRALRSSTPEPKNGKTTEHVNGLTHGNGHASGFSYQSRDLETSTDAEDTALWDAQFAASHDVLEELYAEIMADAKAGRTIEIE